MSPTYFEKLRLELRRYADGVHEPGRPAGAPAIAAAERRLGRPLPRELADLYASWNGLALFFDAYVLLPAERLAPDDDAAPLIRIGETPTGPLLIDSDGRVVQLDDGGERIVCGSSLERWTVALMAREGLLVDADGEWRDVFDEGDVGDAGDEWLKPEVRRRRVRAGIKADPAAASWRVEGAELALEDGRAEEAETELERAVADDPGAATAWALLGALRGRRADPAGAELAFVRAAEGTRDPRLAAERWAEAARAASRSGRAEARASHAARASEADPLLVRRFVASAAALLGDGDPDGGADPEGALNRAELAEAVEPGGAGAALVKRARARRSLRQV